MSFNLIHAPAFPILTRSGARRFVRLPDLACLDGDAPIDFAWPRADLNAAALEFAIGVAALAFGPADEDAWHDLWSAPPSPEEFEEALAFAAHAFELDGDGPRFMQDFEALDGEDNDVEALFIDTPGVNGQKKNADLLTHRGRYAALGLPAAAMALYALQQFAPSGGAGNRTSMRGGGPLSTFVIPGAGGARPPLWRVILANLPAREEVGFKDADLPRILPWLAPTLVSDKAHGERELHDADPAAHKLQWFFGMPRRIRLRFGGEGVCALTGERGPVATGFVQKPWGVNYGTWLHPLTPYRRQKEASEPYSVKPKSARFGYRDWAGVAVSRDGDPLKILADAVAAARLTRRSLLRGDGASDAILRASGWAMSNMEAVAFLVEEQPLHLADDSDAQVTLDALALNLVDAADEAASLLREALRVALFSPGASVATDRAVFDDARVAFLEATEGGFHGALGRFANGGASLEETRAAWLSALKRAARDVFSRYAPIPVEHAERAQRVATAWRHFSIALAGGSKRGEKFFEALGLAPPVKPPAKKSKNAGKSRKGAPS